MILWNDYRGGNLKRDNGLYWEHEGNRAVRVGRWKLVARGKDGPWELYDMKSDRTEMHDLAARYPERVKKMGQLWQDWADRANVFPLQPNFKKRHRGKTFNRKN